MKNLKSLILICALAVGIGTTFAAVQTPVKAPQKAPAATTTTTTTAKKVYIPVASLAIVNNPTKYLNKYVDIKGTFDKFSTLGLDYKPAFKSSEQYISFLLQRDDITDHNVPLSEMKLFLKRNVAEKFIDINSGDKVEVKGKVFSNALGDAWIDVEEFKILEKKPVVKK